jgi:hypothetical protein
MSNPGGGRPGHNWGVEMHAVLDWWISLWPDHGLIGPLIAVVVAVFVVLVAGNVVVWTLVGIKRFGQGIGAGFREQWRSEPEDAHQELRVVDERPVDHR